MTNRPQKFNIFAISLSLAVFLLWAAVLTRKYYTFGYCDWDLAFFTQWMWGILRGDGHSTLFGGHLLGNHSNLFAYVIAPVFAFFPHPLTLVFLKVFSFCVAGLIFFHLAAPRIGEKYALFFLSLYFIYLPNAFGLLHDFDFESLSPAFLMAMLYFYDKDRWRPFIITALLTVTIKENMPLVVAAFGLLGFIFKRDKLRWGVVPLVLGGVTFVLLVKFLIPFMATGQWGGSHRYAYIYADLTSSGSPGVFLDHFKTSILTYPNLAFINNIFAPLLFLPLIYIGGLLPALPIILQHLLSSAPTHHSIYFYYVMPIAPFLFYSMVCLFEKLQKRASTFFLITLSALFLFNFWIQWQMYWPRARASLSCRVCEPRSQSLNAERWQLVRAVPLNAGIVASFAYLPALADRYYLYPFYKLYAEGYQTKTSGWSLPLTASYALIDMDDPWFYSYAPADLNERFSYVLRLLGGAERWGLIAQAGQTVLLKKRE